MVARPPICPILLYNIPQRTGSDMPNDLLAELGQLEHIVGVKQANPANLAKIDGMVDLRRQRRHARRRARPGEPGGILTSSHLFGEEMRRMVDEPERRREIDAGLQDVYRDLAIAPAGLQHQGGAGTCSAIAVGAPALPYVELDAAELAVVRGDARAPRHARRRGG